MSFLSSSFVPSTVAAVTDIVTITVAILPDNNPQDVSDYIQQEEMTRHLYGIQASKSPETLIVPIFF